MYHNQKFKQKLRRVLDNIIHTSVQLERIDSYCCINNHNLKKALRLRKKLKKNQNRLLTEFYPFIPQTARDAWQVYIDYNYDHLDIRESEECVNFQPN